MEYRDLYDEYGNLTGEVILKGENTPINRRLLVAALVIENDENKLLIQKRSAKKKGKWGFTTGHVETKESSIDGIVRETKEELGLDIKKNEITEVKNGINDKYVYHHYYIKKNVDIKSLNIQIDEVEEVKWLTIAEIKSLIKKENFKKSHIDIMENYMNYFDKSYDVS